MGNCSRAVAPTRRCGRCSNASADRPRWKPPPPEAAGPWLDQLEQTGRRACYPVAAVRLPTVRKESSGGYMLRVSVCLLFAVWAAAPAGAAGLSAAELIKEVEHC